MKPKLTIDDYGIKCWRLNGRKHREDGPALICPDGYKAWYINGGLHRIDGPAVMYPQGAKVWYIYDIPFSQKVWFEIILSECLDELI